MVEWKPKKISLMNMMLRGIAQYHLCFVVYPENKAIAPTGATFAIWGMSRAITPPAIVSTVCFLFI